MVLLTSADSIPVQRKRPMTVAELAEGSVIDITSTTEKPFETAERLFNLKSIVDMLSGLISVTTVGYGRDTTRLAVTNAKPVQHSKAKQGYHVKESEDKERSPAPHLY